MRIRINPKTTLMSSGVVGDSSGCFPILMRMARPEDGSMTQPDDPKDPVSDPNSTSADDVPTNSADDLIEEEPAIDDLIDDSLTDDDFDAFVADDRPGGFEDVLNQPGMPPPPRPAPPQAKRKLVRDPYSRLGGVSSGIAHYFGFDVALVRIVVLLGSIFTGIGFLVYFAAWIIIPRAKVWPPVGSDGRSYSIGRSSISGRDLGLGLALIGLLMMFGLGSGAGQFIVPLVLVGGGIWLLRQPAAATAAMPGANGAAFQSAPTGSASTGYASADPYVSTGAAGYTPGPVGQPVPPRSFGRKAFRVALIAPIVLVPIAAIAAAGLFFAVNGDDRGFVDVNPGQGGFNFEAGELDASPLSAAELKPAYVLNAGEIDLDLSALDDSMFSTPVNVLVEGDFADIQITVPEDLSVSVTANGALGDLEVFGQQSDGFGNEVIYTDDNPLVNIDVGVDIGEIDVVRSGG